MGEEFVFMGTIELPHAPSLVSFAPSGHHLYVDYDPRDELEIWHAIYTDVQRKKLHKKTLAWPSGSWHRDDVLYAVNWGKGIALPEYTQVLEAAEGRDSPVFALSAERLARAEEVYFPHMPALDLTSASTLDQLAVQAWQYAEQGRGALAVEKSAAVFSTLEEVSQLTITYFGDTHRDAQTPESALAQKAIANLAEVSRVYFVNEKDERLQGRTEDRRSEQLFMMSGGEATEVTAPDLRHVRGFHYDEPTNRVLVSVGWEERQWLLFDATNGERFLLDIYDPDRRALLTYDLVPGRDELAVDVQYLDDCHIDTISRSLEFWDRQGNILDSIPLPVNVVTSRLSYGSGGYWLSSEVVGVLWTEQVNEGNQHKLHVYRRE